MTDFDQIDRRYKSRVPGSPVTMTPLDMVRNVDAHSFITKEAVERIEQKIERLEQKVDQIVEGKF